MNEQRATFIARGVSGLRERDRARMQNEAADHMILQSLAGLPAFLVYFCTALVAVIAYLFVYTRVTPHDEFQLIRDNVPGADLARPQPARLRVP